MRKILIPINPEHVAKILSGEKKFEYRTKIAQKDVDTLVIYETAPVKRVVGAVPILEVLALSPEELWAKTKDYSGISKSFYDAYFQGRSVAYASLALDPSPREILASVKSRTLPAIKRDYDRSESSDASFGMDPSSKTHVPVPVSSSNSDQYRLFR